MGIGAIRGSESQHNSEADPTQSIVSIEKIRVLHIDDEEDQQMFLKVFVEGDSNIKVTSVRNASDTLELIKTGAYDCLVSDYDMPDMNGIDLAKKVRETSNIPIIIYTGRGSEEVAERAFAAGIDDYIRKEQAPAHYQVVSKRIRQAVERRRSSEIYRNLFDNASDAIFIRSLDGKILDVNDVACKRLGYSKEALMKMSTSQIMKPILEDHERNVTKVKVDGHAIFESSNLTCNGDLIPVEVSVRVIKYMGAEAILSFSRDISDRKRLEAEMSRRVKSIHSHVTTLATLNSLEEVAKFSLEMLSKLGYLGDNGIGLVVGNNLKFVYSRDTRHTISELPMDGTGITVRAARMGQTQCVNDTRLDPDYITENTETRLSELVVPVKVMGRVVAVINIEDERVNAFTDQDRELIEILSEHISSTASRIEQIEAIKRSEETYHKLVNSSFELIAVISENKVKHINDVAARLLGYEKPEDLIGADISALLPEDELSRVNDSIHDIEAGNPSSGRYEVKLKTRSGGVVEIETTTALTSHDGAPAVLVYGKDCTERNLHNRRLDALHRHATKLVNLDTVEDVAVCTFDIISELLGFTIGTVGVVDGGFLRFVYSRNLPYEMLHNLPIDGRGIMVRAIRTGVSQLVCDTRLDPDYVRGFKGVVILSELDVPVKIGDKVVAVINLEDDEPGTFKEDDRGILEILSEHVASAMSRIEKTGFLRASDERCRSLLDNSMDSVIVIQGTRIVYANVAAAKLRGYDTPNEIVGRESIEFIPEDERKMILDRQIRKQRGEDQPLRYCMRLLRSDGAVVDVENVASRISYEGKPAILAIARDMSQVRRLEERLVVLHKHAVMIGAAGSLEDVSTITVNAIKSVMGFDLASFLLNEGGSLAEHTECWVGGPWLVYTDQW